MNSFDIVVLALALTPVVMGFQSGLLRSVAPIIGYLCAAPVALVVTFDRMIPPHGEPGFLKESRLRPALSWAGQRGLRSLPPEVADYIDRLKRERIRA